MNLKKTIALEVTVAVIVVAVIAILIEVTPYLASSSQNNQIGVFNQREYAQKTTTIQPGEKVASQFNYTTYDPAILVVDVKFQDWQTPGYLSFYCNGILVVSFVATPSNPEVQLTSVAFSGYDLVKSPPIRVGISLAFAYGNEVSFVSPQSNGYAGTFSYTISIRGSR